MLGKTQAEVKAKLKKAIEEAGSLDVAKAGKYLSLIHISRMLVSLDLPEEGEETFAFLQTIHQEAERYYDAVSYTHLIPVQLLCGKLLKRCGHNGRVPAFEKHKVTGLFALNLFQRKIYVVFLRRTLKGWCGIKKVDSLFSRIS